MILVTVGMQLGFDRLIAAMDALALQLDMPVIAQTGVGEFKPLNMEASSRIAPDEFEKLVQQSRLIVSHAGIGTVLTAQRFQKPIVLIPRRAKLGEHRNDHQLATAEKLEGRPGILIAQDETQLAGKIHEGLEIGDFAAQRSDSAEQLQTAITRFIETGAL
ncbi:glycosyltransferase [Erythrobacter sp. MTPC3]|uniref:glycosyltransferase n=1 Tax=Erythrobacter sp. MTPC3 TaxID=3056564 RepID=UPI0036F22EF6